jgi:hypothetical protein
MLRNWCSRHVMLVPKVSKAASPFNSLRSFYLCSSVTEVGPAYPRDLLARALLAPPAPLSTAPSHLASSLA